MDESNDVDAYKELLDEATAFAIVGKSGLVAFSYAGNSVMNLDPSDCAKVIALVAELLESKKNAS